MTDVLIADDQALVRVGLRKILDAEPELAVVGEAGDGEDAVSAARRLRPDVVLMDIRMPVLDGIEATRRIVRERPAARVLILTTFGLDTYVYDALRAGASGFMLKDAPPEEIAAAVRIVASGDALLAPAVTRAVIEEFARLPDAARAGGPRPARARALEPGDLRAARGQRGDDQDPRRPHPPEARRPRPRAGGHLRVRERSRRAGLRRLSGRCRGPARARTIGAWTRRPQPSGTRPSSSATASS
jgi:DNA-binding NarL/FixJ family response regulator